MGMADEAGGTMTEDQLLIAVLELAKFAGWRVTHFRPARTSRGWRTAVQGDKGWPDLMICGHGRFLVVELKASGGKLSEEQLRWQDELVLAGVEYQVWRPIDWTEGMIAGELGCAGGVIPHREEG